MTATHYHPCNDARCADIGTSETVFEAHRDGRDCGQRPCPTCLPDPAVKCGRYWDCRCHHGCDIP